MPWMGLGPEGNARWTNVLYKDAPTGTHIFVAVSTFLLAILIAYGAYRLYDLPVREWLKKQLFKPATLSDANKTK